MKTKFDARDWRDFLPESFRWLDRLQCKITTGDTLTKENGLHVVAVDTTDDTKAFDIQSNILSGATKAKIFDTAKKMAWNGKGSALRISVDDCLVLLVARSKIQTTKTQRARQLGIDIAKSIKDNAPENLVLVDLEGENLLDVFDGMAQAMYAPSLFKGDVKKSEPNKNFPKNLFFQSKNLKEDAIVKTKDQAKALALTMMLQDCPPNYLNPVKFGEIALDLAKELGIKAEAWGRERLEKESMGSYLSVAGGSNIEPRLITLQIPGRDTSKTVAMIGKGLTFDSGGISLKPSLGMGEMKYDMSGGAAVLGTAYFLAKHKPRYNTVCIIGAVENMPGWYATRPSDIVTSMSGKTIEIQNTDAEGRLVLCDLLHYAKTTFKPAFMLDIATLTGAVLMALGHAGAALMSNHTSLAGKTLEIASQCGEPLWQLPLWPEIAKEIKSEIADLVNIAKPNVLAGTVVAGAFLNEFVGDTPWLHVDVAGTAWQCSATGYPSGGASAYGLRLMSALCEMEINL